MRQGHGRPPRLPTDGFYLKSEGHTSDFKAFSQILGCFESGYVQAFFGGTPA